MHPSETETLPTSPVPSFFLDYGADAERSQNGIFEISERGMRFESRWQFSIGTQLNVCVHHMHPRLGLARMIVEGIVVWCEPTQGKRFESTLLFLEIPDELKTSLRDFSHLVTPAQ